MISFWISVVPPKMDLTRPSAEVLAEQLPRPVHVRGDLFRRMVINDCVHIRWCRLWVSPGLNPAQAEAALLLTDCQALARPPRASSSWRDRYSRNAVGDGRQPRIVSSLMLRADPKELACRRLNTAKVSERA
jgi:hypothetical protein